MFAIIIPLFRISTSKRTRSVATRFQNKLCGTWLGGQAVYTNTGQLYASVAGRDLADDVTRNRFDVRSRLDCASACAESDYCVMFAVCRRGPGEYLRATSACTKRILTHPVREYNAGSLSVIKQQIDNIVKANSH